MTCNTPICAQHCDKDYCAEKDAIGSWRDAVAALAAVKVNDPYRNAPQDRGDE